SLGWDPSSWPCGSRREFKRSGRGSSSPLRRPIWTSMGVAVVDRRPIGLGRIITTGLLVTLSLVFFVVHLRAWGASHRPVGLGAMALDLVAVTLFIIRRHAFVVSLSLVAWIAAPIGADRLLAFRPHYAPVGGLGAL